MVPVTAAVETSTYRLCLCIGIFLGGRGQLDSDLNLILRIISEIMISIYFFSTQCLVVLILKFYRNGA